jgi:hypothetical protein
LRWIGKRDQGHAHTLDRGLREHREQLQAHAPHVVRDPDAGGLEPLPPNVGPVGLLHKGGRAFYPDATRWRSV